MYPYRDQMRQSWAYGQVSIRGRALLWRISGRSVRERIGLKEHLSWTPPLPPGPRPRPKPGLDQLMSKVQDWRVLLYFLKSQIYEIYNVVSDSVFDTGGLLFSTTAIVSESSAITGAQSFTSVTVSRRIARDVSGGLPQSVANRLTLYWAIFSRSTGDLRNNRSSAVKPVQAEWHVHGIICIAFSKQWLHIYIYI